MKKSNILISVWSTVLVTTGIILYLVFVEWIPEQYIDFLYVIVGTAIINLLFIELSKRLREPIILIEPCNKLTKVGFSVRVKDKPVRDASVICNEIAVPWENLDGNEYPSKKLQVGANPSYFFPFFYEFTNSSITDTEQFVIIRLYQNKSVYDNRTKPQPILLTDGYYTIPRGYFEPTCGKTQIKPHFEANIRITGDEIGEEVYRSFNVHFWPVFQRETESDKFEDIELAGLGFKAVEKRFFLEKNAYS